MKIGKSKGEAIDTVSRTSAQVKARAEPLKQHRPPLQSLSEPPSKSFTKVKSTQARHKIISSAARVSTHSLAFQTVTSGNASLPWQNLTKQAVQKSIIPSCDLQTPKYRLEATVEGLREELTTAQRRASTAESEIRDMRQELSDAQNRTSIAERRMTDPRRGLFASQTQTLLAEAKLKDIQARRLKDYEILSLCRTSTNSIMSDFLSAHQASTESRAKYTEEYRNSIHEEIGNFQGHLDNIPTKECPGDEVLGQARALLRYISITNKHRQRYLSRTAAIDKRDISDTKVFKRSLDVVDDEYFEKEDEAERRRQKRRRRTAAQQYS